MNKILVVDNSIVIINLLEDLFLKKNDFILYSAKSAKEAQELCKKNDFFLVVSNMVLPDALNGEILDYFESKQIPTLILSSTIDDHSLKMLQRPNIIDYVLKDSIHVLGKVYRLIELLHDIQGMEVLIVEDSLLSATQMKTSLESLLLKVHHAKNGKMALKLLEKKPTISMIITDFNMPQMNGLELIRQLRQEDKYFHIPILVISSIEENDLKVKLYKCGATDFLPKPILQEELKSKVLNVFENIKHIKERKLFDKIFDENVISSSTDYKGIIKNVSQAFSDISGYSKEELIDKPHNIVRHPDMPSSVFKELWSTVKSGKKWRGEVKNLRKDGTYYWVKAVVEPNYNKKGEIIGFTSIRQDITDKKRIYELSITDGLTSLYNRRYFNDIAPRKIHDTARNSEVFAFLLMDIDNFKKYNDTYGHIAGDEVLVKVSQTLKDVFKRSEDIVFRLGGEEFGVLINAKSVDDVEMLAQRARIGIETLNIEHIKNSPKKILTASFGLTILLTQNQEISLEEVYKKSDDSLYQAKENGRNCVESIYI